MIVINNALILESVLDALKEKGLQAHYHKSYNEPEKVLAVAVRVKLDVYECNYRVWPEREGTLQVAYWWPMVACPDKLIVGGLEVENPDVYDRIVAIIRADSDERFKISIEKNRAFSPVPASSGPASPYTRTPWGVRSSSPYNPYTRRSS